MASSQGASFLVIEVQGYREREIASAESLEEIAEQLNAKTGLWSDG